MNPFPELEKMSDEQLELFHLAIIDVMQRRIEQRNYKELSRFSVGDKVYFVPHDGKKVTGTIIRLNKKTASIHSDDHRDWKVSPQLLKKLNDKSGVQKGGKVFALHQ